MPVDRGIPAEQQPLIEEIVDPNAEQVAARILSRCLPELTDGDPKLLVEPFERLRSVDLVDGPGVK